MTMKRFFCCLVILAWQLSCQNDRSQQENKNEVPSTSQVLPTSTDNDALTAESDTAVSAQGIPVARYSISPAQGDTNTVFTFDASASSGTIIKYRWSFGDGDYDKGKVVTHRYHSGGDFQVKLTVVSDTKNKDKKIKTLTVDGSGDGGTPCTVPAPNRGFIFGTVVGVQGFNAIVQLPAGLTCANSYYYCGDMRRANPEQFRGIIHAMSDLGNSKFSIFNDCPFRWPPAIGETDFLYWKKCSQNYCP